MANEKAILSIVCRSDLDSTIRATSSAYNNAFIIWEAIGTPILCSESISVRSFIITEKSDGDKIHHWFTPLSWLNHSDSRFPRTTLLLTVLNSSFSKRHFSKIGKTDPLSILCQTLCFDKSKKAIYVFNLDALRNEQIPLSVNK